uniref:Putative contactin 3 plasmacytoma associated n=1 Tax=Corethrella appendiculata TaxID=1370023 RepID=W4VRM9_9DIPT
MQRWNIYRLFGCLLVLTLLEINLILCQVNQYRPNDPYNRGGDPYTQNQRNNPNLQNQNLNQPQYGQQSQQQYGQERQRQQQQQIGPINNDLGGGGSFYDNQNRYSSSPIGGYNSPGGIGGFNQYGIDGFDPNAYCPENWLAYRSTCIRIHKSPRKNWLNAKKICQANQGDLINIDTIEKHTFIFKHLIQDNNQNNRYFVSARQTSPNNWANDDNSPLVNVEGLINYTEDIENEEHQDNYLKYDQEQNLKQQNQQNWRHQQQYGPYGPLAIKDRLVYGFSHTNDKWQLFPAYDYDENLFICESYQLYSVNNINLRADDKREYDYGLEITDFEKIPRGPYFIKQPRDTTYDTGKFKNVHDVSISCLAGGYPVPTYSWFKEEYKNDNLTYTKIDPLRDSRYTLSGGNLIIYKPEQTRDQGTYHCVAENKFGRIMSESVQLNFGYILEFNLQRSSETGEMNWGKALFCDPPQHYPRVKYYWSRDYFPNFVEEDQRVFVSHDGALYFSSLETIDRANYSCTVQSLVSDTGRNGPFFNLRVMPHSNYQELIFANSFPKIFPEAPVAGEEVRLECVAFGYPVSSYNWTRRNTNLPRNSYLTSYNRVLIIPNATVNDNGEYICTVKNDRKTMQKSVFLSIQMRPNFTIPLRDKIRDFQSDVDFYCEANAIPDVNYTWYKNGELLEWEKMNKDKFIIQDNILKIKYLDPDEDNGMYQCKATNQLKGVYSSAQLRVLSMKPSFKKKPLESEIYAIYNGNTTIECEPEAAPLPKFQWKKDGNVIGSGGHRRILPTGTLIISPTSRDDEGVYTCIATNTYGTDESHARLIVLQELRFTQTLPPRVITQIDELMFLQCNVIYDEILDVAFIWTHNGQIINPSDDVTMDDPRFFTNYNSLEVHNVTLLDGGDYECIAKSAVNRIVSKTNVIVQGPPGAPGGVKVIDIKKREAILEWIDGTSNGRPIMYYNILGRTNWNKTWANVSEGVVAIEVDRYNGRRRAEVTGLTPWSGYEFSVAAVNDLGVGVPSAPSPLYSTSDDKPYVHPKNVGGGGGKIGDLTITWEPLKPQEQNGANIHYKIFWRLHGKQTEWATDVLKKQGNVGQAVVHIPFDNYYTKYDVKVQAWNHLGAGPESPIVVIYSAEDMPQTAPQLPVARSFNSTALNMSWVPVNMTRENIRGKLIGHRLKYWKKDHAEEDAVYYLSRTIRPWALIVGLEPDTYYFVKVMAYNSAGEGPESERYLERTYRNAPQKPPSSVFIYGINPSTVRVVWRYISPSQEEEPIQGYKIRVWEIDQDMSTANDTIIWVGNKLEGYVDNLTPGKSYKMRVLAFSNGGDGRMSSPTLQFQMGITQSPNTATGKFSIINSLLVASISMTFYLFLC